ncbi:helix-turn-helix transcriptional regulator [Lactobacillus sp. ESL0681]|uniref:helix-turn-helix domain-containing protein n=1 Tax=Lactobacillus sp. ESL0681 TaxID=2983211 RepID=UPI0023F8EC30|nr:helix-turn-helix transcriptional regulator [Lactobacillus sp. ESL0681]WEV41290.1 helix-turn-helix transcriptional regulator [Lactobacillus sp. ESL0681]
MDVLDRYIRDRSQKDPEFKEELKKADERLDASLMLVKLRDEEGLSQRELAKKANVAKSTITKIETGQMNPTFNLMDKIVTATGRQIKLELI